MRIHERTGRRLIHESANLCKTQLQAHQLEHVIAQRLEVHRAGNGSTLVVWA